LPIFDYIKGNECRYIYQINFILKAFTMKNFLFFSFLISSLISFGSHDINHVKDAAEVRYYGKENKVDSEIQKLLFNQAKWQSFNQVHPGWQVLFNQSSGLPHRAYGGSIQLHSGSLVANDFLQLLQSELSIFNLNTNELHFESAPRSDRYLHYNFSQIYRGLPVIDSKVTFKVSHDNRLLLFGLDYMPNLQISTQPSITPEAAMAAGKMGVNAEFVGSDTPELAILPLPVKLVYNYKLIYRCNLSFKNGNELMKYKTYVDALTGEVLYRVNKVNHAIDISLNGTIYPTHPYNPTATGVMQYGKINVAGNDFFADSLGQIFLTNTSSVNATVSFEGPWARVFTGTTGGNPTSFVTTLNPGSNIISWNQAGTDEEINAYHHTNIIHDYMKSYLPSFNALDVPLEVRVSRTDGSCNAFYDGSSINFYVTAGGCYALSLAADVVYHEYGHGITNRFYDENGTTFDNGAMGEGYSDVWGISLTQNPILGIGFSDSDPNAFVRRYDVNKKVYPQDLVGQVHADGEIIAGCWYDTYLNIGSWSYMNYLFAQTFYPLPNAPDGQEGQLYTDILIEAIYADDDDANLANGTPNLQAILDAFDLHGITLANAANLSHTELFTATSGTGILISANLTNTLPFLQNNVSLFYKVNNAPSFSSIPMLNTIGTTFEATIPGQAAGSIVSYYIATVDAGGVVQSSLPSEAAAADPNIPYFILVGYNLEQLDDLETSGINWTVNPAATDNATTGIWLIADPVSSFAGTEQVQIEDDHTSIGVNCAITANASIGDPAGTQDVDAGATTIQSPSYSIGAINDPAIAYWRFYSNDQGSTPGTDSWKTFVSIDNIQFTQVLENTPVADHNWRRFAFRLSDYFAGPFTTVSLRFVAEDAATGSLIEAAVDDIEIYDLANGNNVDDITKKPLLLFPNPASDFITILNKELGNNLIKIYDASNRLVMQTTATNNQTLVNVSTLTNGVYTISIDLDKAIYKARFCKIQ
jgi:Zn-dependent metalloprotease